MKPRDRLTRRTVEALEQFLRSRQAQLAESVRNAISRQRIPEEGSGADPTVRASATLDGEIWAALMDRQNRQLAEIEAALDRLRRGDYGLCHGCGTFIGLVRLKALPFAWRCSRCQGRAEIGSYRATRAVLAAVAAPARSR